MTMYEPGYAPAPKKQEEPKEKHGLLSDFNNALRSHNHAKKMAVYMQGADEDGQPPF